MPSISIVDSLNTNDLVIVYPKNEQTYRGATAALFSELIQETLNTDNVQTYKTQYASPNVEAFVVESSFDSQSSGSVHLILTPTSGFSAGVVQLPDSSLIANGTIFTMNCTQAIGAFVFDINGASGISGAPTSIAANDFMSFRYDQPSDRWYRIG